MTHAELTERAMLWLRSSQVCRVTIRDPIANAGLVDAIGWRKGQSYAVKCLVSWKDMLAAVKDAHELGPHRRPASWVYFLAEEPLAVAIHQEALPPGWGLLSLRARQIRTLVVATNAPRADDCRTLEISWLCTELRSYQQLVGAEYQRAVATPRTRARRVDLEWPEDQQ